MEAIISFLEQVSEFVWGPYMLIFLVGTGVYLTLGLRGQTVRKIGYAFKLLMRGRKKEQQEGEGDITPFQALMTSMSATIGTGNIAGVATAIFLGGPGAVFWMWITALFGMATKFGESILAVKTGCRVLDVDYRFVRYGHQIRGIDFGCKIQGNHA